MNASNIDSFLSTFASFSSSKMESINDIGKFKILLISSPSLI